MKQRIITALILITLFSSALILSNSFLYLLIFAFILIAGYEIYHVNQARHKWYILAFIVGVLIASSIWLPTTNGMMVVNGIALCTLFSFAIFDESVLVTDVTYYFTFLMILVAGITAIKYIVSMDRLVFFYIIVATFATDTFAYFGGKLFGKHKLIPRISPNKTVEGSIAGIIGSLIMSLSLGYFTLQNYVPFNITLIASICIPFIAQLGDLSFSLVKRHYGIKDFGNIFPGHGGVLDRVDSLIFTMIFYYVLLLIML